MAENINKLINFFNISIDES